MSDGRHALRGRGPRRAGSWIGVALGLAIAAPLSAQPVARRISPGVEAQLGVDAEGVRTVQRVRISLPRRPGDPPPELGPALVAAYDWCAGNVPNGFESRFLGFETPHGCRIDVDTGVYRIRDTAVLRQTRGQRVLVEIDLGNSTILHMPDPPHTLRVRDLAKEPCNASTQGHYFNVEDPESLDAIDAADPEGPVEIAQIGPNTGRTPGCPRGGVVCKFGGQTIRVETRTPHGLDDGGPLGIGDLVELTVPRSEYDRARVLVKEVVSPTVFLATLDHPPREVVAKGSVRETATTAWCNGASWRAGKPMIAIGGPGSMHQARTVLRGGTFAFDAELYRTTAILVDGEKAADGMGGAGWVEIEGAGHVGNGSLRGQILVVLGTTVLDRSFCLGLDVDVYSDYLGGSWSPAVWNQTCDTTRIHVRQHHGGGVWWGLDAPGYTGPSQGSLIGYLEGCKDGPCLWVRSGKLVLADGFKVAGSVWGPQGPARGANSGRVAILGTRRGIGVNVVAHGATWFAGQDSDLDCYVTLGNVSNLVQSGGYLVSGNAETGDGEEYLFCTVPGTQQNDITLEHVEKSSWGGPPRILKNR